MANASRMIGSEHVFNVDYKLLKNFSTSNKHHLHGLDYQRVNYQVIRNYRLIIESYLEQTALYTRQQPPNPIVQFTPDLATILVSWASLFLQY